MTVRDPAAASGEQRGRARSSKASLYRHSRNPDLLPRFSGLPSASGTLSGGCTKDSVLGSLRVQRAYRLDSESIFVKPLEEGRYDWSSDQ